MLVNINLLTTIPGLDEPPHLFTKNAALNHKSIRKLEALKPKVMAFGHGPVLYNHGDLEDFLKTLKD